ncbi:phospholipase [Microbacterium sp. P04]|uniref:aggregation-promoting factor C-terminal-like domain-containing protein n=1 Tax=Microbacterium sp. P04 TaxID=3366947 RepID=UPI003744C61C
MRSEQKISRARKRRNTRTLVAVGTAAGLTLGLFTTAATASADPVAASASTFAALAPFATLASTGLAAPAVGSITTSTADADAALTDARTVLNDASALTVEVSESGLDLGTDGATIDTAALRSAILDLTKADVVPVLLFPDLADNASEQADVVRSEIGEQRAALDAATAAKAAADAAAQAQAEAEAAAAAQAQAAADALAAANTPDGARATARQMAADRYGWGGDQFSCLASLWQKESGWNYRAYNASGGATGIPQALPGSKMASAGSDWQTNAATQISWGLDYISRGYGTPCSAWSHSQAMNWY